MLNLGIIGTAPQWHQGAVRAGTWRQFQSLLGELIAENAPDFLGGHAACHAFINGVERVSFATVADLKDKDELASSLVTLIDQQKPDLIVIPGVYHRELVGHLITAWLGTGDGQRQPLLYIDIPPRASLSEIITYCSEVRSVSETIGFVTPWISTQTTGLRQMVPLPPTCLAGPLLLGTVPQLKGIHEMPRDFSPSECRRLQKINCRVLQGSGTLGKVHLVGPPVIIKENPVEVTPVSLEERLRTALQAACQPVLAEYGDGPALWNALVRNGKAVLAQFQERGVITTFGIHCDGTLRLPDQDGPIMEVWFTTPRRVKKVQFILTAIG